MLIEIEDHVIEAIEIGLAKLGKDIENFTRDEVRFMVTHALEKTKFEDKKFMLELICALQEKEVS